MRVIKNLFRSLFPPMRQAITLWMWLPMVLFLVLFMGGCYFLDSQNHLSFTRPVWFFLLLLTPWVWWLYVNGYSGLSRGRALTSFVVRLCLIGLFIILLTEPRTVQKNDSLSVVYVVDVSDSVGESTDKALEYVARTVSGLRNLDDNISKEDKVGLVVFGKNASVELPVRRVFFGTGHSRRSENMEAYQNINSRIYKDGTNIEKALSLASALLPQDGQGKIVLISDGTETEGDLAPILETLKASQIKVDVLPIKYNYEHEVWVEKVELPKKIKLAEEYEAGIILNSIQKGKGTLTLKENDVVIYQEEVEFKPGKNQYKLKFNLKRPGYYEYTAHIEVPEGKDGRPENNRAINYIFLRGQGQVLVVIDPEGNADDYVPFVKTLRDAKRLVEIKSTFEFPRNTLKLMPYDCIVFANVPADHFDPVQFAALNDAVYNQGIGFLMIGGSSSYGPGGYHNTDVEKILPVRMDIDEKKIIPKGALVIILHTCEFPQGNSWGKQITKRAIQVLGNKDEVGVLFQHSYGNPAWLFELTPASNYLKLVPLINKAQMGDIRLFTPTMTMGLEALKKSDAATKHMIIISDGDPQIPAPQIMQQFVDSKISVSTVTINPHGGRNSNDVAMMRHIATVTGGRAYYVDNAKQLPSIFIKEAKTLKRSMIQNTTFTPTLEDPSSIMNGIAANIPQLHGYVLTSVKPRATVVLKGPEKEQIDPVLATWNYGVGKSAAFTSDLGTNWCRDWLNSSLYKAFVKQLIIKISRVDKKSHLYANMFHSGSNGIIVIEDHHPDGSFLTLQSEVTGPQGKRQMVKLHQVGPNRYKGSYPLWGKGRYYVQIAGSGDGREEKARSGFVLPYSSEYLRFRSNPSVLNHISNQTGGNQLSGEETSKDIFSVDRTPKYQSKLAIIWFLLALAFLIPFDVGLRRVQVDWEIVRSWFGVRQEDSTETMGALLKRKKDMKHESDEEREFKSRVPQIKKSPPPSRKKVEIKKPESSKPSKQADPDDGGSTTSRLLRRKREWKEDQDE